jgi:hypothetical protein
LKTGAVDPTILIVKSFPLREAAVAVQYAQERGVMKVLLKA